MLLGPCCWCKARKPGRLLWCCIGWRSEAGRRHVEWVQPCWAFPSLRAQPARPPAATGGPVQDGNPPAFPSPLLATSILQLTCRGIAGTVHSLVEVREARSAVAPQGSGRVNSTLSQRGGHPRCNYKPTDKLREGPGQEAPAPAVRMLPPARRRVIPTRITFPSISVTPPDVRQQAVTCTI